MQCYLVVYSGSTSIAASIIFRSLHLGNVQLVIREGDSATGRLLWSTTGTVSASPAVTATSCTPYLYIAFQSGSYYTPQSGFTAELPATVAVTSCSVSPSPSPSPSPSLTPLSYAYLTDSCPGPALVQVSAFSGVQLISPSSTASSINCSIIVDSGADSLGVEFSLRSFNPYSYADRLQIRDGNSTASSLLLDTQSSYSSLTRSCGRYLLVSFQSRSFVQGTYPGGFTAAITSTSTVNSCSRSSTRTASPSFSATPLSMAYLDSSCPGPTTVNLATSGVSGVALTASPFFGSSLDCVMTIFSGSLSTGVFLNIRWLSATSNDLLIVREGNSTADMVLAYLHGSTGYQTAVDRQFTSCSPYLTLQFRSASTSAAAQLPGFVSTVHQAPLATCRWYSTSAPGLLMC
jgi:hypothetical protein